MTSSLLKSIISIPSPSREEKAVADFLQHWLEEHGLAPHRCGDNLWCSKGSGPVLLLDAHIDTVKPAQGWETDPFTPVCDGDRITGLGANDDGGSVVAMIKAFMEASPKKHTLVLSLSAQEEISGNGGLESVLPQIENACGPIEAGIIGEPTSLKMASSENGLMVLDCEARGKAGHAARGDGSNAIANALPDIQWFLDNGMQVTQIQAGTQHNVIPASCTFVVDVRSKEDNKALLEHILKNVSCSVKPRSTRLCGSSIQEDHALVKAGKALGLETFHSPTLSNQAICPFPTVKTGPGDSSRSHGAGEYIGLDEIEKAVSTYVNIIEEYENLG